MNHVEVVMSARLSHNFNMLLMRYVCDGTRIITINKIVMIIIHTGPTKLITNDTCITASY